MNKTLDKYAIQMTGKVKQIEEKIEFLENKMAMTTKEINEDLDMAFTGTKTERNSSETEMNCRTTWERHYGKSCQSCNRINGMGRGSYWHRGRQGI